VHRLHLFEDTSLKNTASLIKCEVKSVIRKKVKASLIIERHTGIYTMDNATAEFIVASRLTEFVPWLFKAMNEILIPT